MSDSDAASGANDPDGATPTGARTPEQIGAYHISSVLGRGGMGVVYRAVQHEPIRRDVALKTIALGLDGAEVTKRFEAERQVLARMSHPSIAQVYDAGVTDDGRSYFAMEYVAGAPLGEFCDAARLTLEARVRLFVKICRAVHHAHQKGVIHRDLKPGNVLVTEVDGEPLPKVIDFGIAKATEGDGEERARLTQDAQVLGTPIYMSPEQVEGSLDIDTRTDVYALGVMLYELLVGALPHPPSAYRGWAAMAAALVHEPPTLSRRLDDLPDSQVTMAELRSSDVRTLRRSLSGDLEWIVAKALEKSRDRRYDSANELADDLERHLRFEPVVAGPPSRSYRATRFVRRHRVAVAAGVVMALGLSGGAIAATLGLARALRAERAALASAIVAQADATDDVRLAALLLSELEGEPEPAGGLSVATSVAGGAIPSVTFDDATSVFFVAVGPDGEWAVTADYERVHVRRLDGSGVALELTGIPGTIQDVSLGSAVDRVLVSGRARTAGDSGQVLFQQWSGVWSAHTGERVGGGELWSFAPAAHHPDGRRLVGRDPATGKAEVRYADGFDVPVELVGHPGPGAPEECRISCRVAAFSADGALVALGSDDGTARVWRVESGVPVAEFAHTAGVGHVSFSPDGTLLATAADGRVRVWSLDSGRPLLFPRSALGRADVLFGPDGTNLAVATLDSTWIWDFRAGAEPRELSGRPGNVRFGPRGRLVALLHPQGTSVHAMEGASSPVALPGAYDGQFTPDGASVLLVNDGPLSLWPIFQRAGVVLADPLEGRLWSSRMDRDGSSFRAVGQGQPARFRSARTGDGRGQADELELPGRAIAMGDDGSSVATLDEDRLLLLLPEAGSPPLVLPGPTQPIRRAWMSRRGEVVASLLADYSVGVWVAGEGVGPVRLSKQAVPVGGGHADYPVAVSPDGRWVGVIVSEDGSRWGTPWVWSTSELSSPRALSVAEGPPSFLVWGRGGRWLAAGAQGDDAGVALGYAYLWDSEENFRPRVLGPYEGWVTDVRPTADGKLAVVVEGDNVWLEPLTEGVERRQVVNREYSLLGAADDEGRWVAAAGPTAVHLWDTSRPSEPALVFERTGPLVESTGAAPLGELDISADGSRLLTGFQGRPRVWITDWDELVTAIRRSTTACLSRDQRVRFLLESTEEAAQGRRDCERRFGRPGS